jgi:hypothetical protein
MKIVNKYIPFKGYKAMAVFPFIFIRKEYEDRITDETINHEKIHFEQQKELLIIPFYVWYIMEYLIKLFTCDNAYRSISFEREAHSNDDNLDYLKVRKRYSFIKYLFKIV